MSKLIIPKTTTAYRETAVPKAADLLFDTDLNKMVIGDGVTPGGIVINASGGTASSEVTAGFGINVVDNEVSLKRFDAIESLVSGGTVQAGHAYKLNATSSSGTTIYAEWFANDTFARDPAHIEIMVNGVGYLHLGQKTTPGSETAPFVLVGALEPDAMNNVTVRFHDGVAVMTVEDHIGGYVVISGGTSQATAGTLPYALVNTGSDASPYITFSSELNGTTFDVTGVTVTTERHVVGNGYDETKITGDVNVGTSGTLTMAAVGLQNVTVVGGTLTLGDAYIPSGSTVAVSGGGLAVEKVTGNGGTIDLGGTHVALVYGQSFVASGCVVANGSGYNGGAMTGGRVSGLITSCTFSNNKSTQVGGALYFFEHSNVNVNSCVFSANTGNGGIFSFNSSTVNVSSCTLTGNGNASLYSVVTCEAGATATITDTVISGNSYVGDTGDIYDNGGVVVLNGGNNIQKIVMGGGGNLQFANSNTVGIVDSRSNATSGSVTLTSGAILDLTGNSNAMPINPGGGITFESGGATVLYSSGAVSGSYMMDNATLPAGAKLTNTAVIDLGGKNVVISSGTTAIASGCTFTNGSATSGGAILASFPASLVLSDCVISGNTANNANVQLEGGSTLIDSSTVSGNIGTALMRDVYITGGASATVKNSVIEYIGFGRGELILDGNNTLTQVTSVYGNGNVTISSGASINLTNSIAPGGGITVLTGGCTVNGNAIPAGTYTSIDSNGTPT